MSEANEAAFRAVTDRIVNHNDLGVIEEVFASNFVDHNAPAGVPTDLAAIKAFYTQQHAAFPDFHYTIDDLIVVGDKVVGRCTATATMQGEFLGKKPTGKTATWTEIHIGRFANGKWVEHWATIDQLDMFLQLGLIPPLRGSAD
jgi:predicted ester cyclase